jgi:hypothetical protein
VSKRAVEIGAAAGWFAYRVQKAQDTSLGIPVVKIAGKTVATLNPWISCELRFSRASDFVANKYGESRS